MNKFLVVVFLIMLLLPVVCFAGDEGITLRTTLLIDRYDDVKMQDVRTTIGAYDMPKLESDDYEVRLLVGAQTVYSSFFHVYFKRLDSPYLLEEVAYMLKVPYFGNKGQLLILHDGVMIYSFDLANLCNRDNECSNYETHLSCPADCAIEFSDRICEPYIDGICDPDCSAVDKDCLPSERDFTGFYFAGALLIGLLLISYAILEIRLKKGDNK